MGQQHFPFHLSCFFELKFTLLCTVKAVTAWSLAFDQRQIEGQPLLQNWPLLCALQHCCWFGDLKTNTLGSRPAVIKIQKITGNCWFARFGPISCFDESRGFY